MPSEFKKASKRNESLNEFHSLFSVGVATLIHHLEGYRKGYTFVDDTESENVDVSAANFQFVLFMDKEYLPFIGMSFRMSLAMRSVLMTHSAINRWILRKEEAASASLSNADASFVYVTRCTLRRAHIIILIAFILAKFISFPKCSFNIENKSLLL